jgi:hypothetical protein
MRQQWSWLRTVASLVAGALCGAGFGVAFGWMASWFMNGPEVWQGITESVPWFTGMGAVGGFFLGLEKKEQAHEK